jgi:hypothetical protein
LVTSEFGPLTCSSDQVNINDSYSCSGLDPEGNYSITVGAINCGHQEGSEQTFNVELPREENTLNPDLTLTSAPRN